MTNQEYSELTEVHLPSGKLDSKNRRIGFTVGFADNGTDFRAYVQNARLVKNEWCDFGVRQRSKSFTSQKSAVAWAYQTANKRIANLT